MSKLTIKQLEAIAQQLLKERALQIARKLREGDFAISEIKSTEDSEMLAVIMQRFGESGNF